MDKVTRARKLYAKDTYRDLKIMDEKRRKRGKVTSFYEPILERLYLLGMKSKVLYSRPVAICLTFAFEDGSDDFPISEVVNRLRDKLRKPGKNRKKENTFRLLYLWCHEIKFISSNDPEFKNLSELKKALASVFLADDSPIPFSHYHMILFLDAKKATFKSIEVVMDKLVNQGFLRKGYFFSRNNTTREKEMKLNSNLDFQDYFYRASYLAKTDTKDLEDKRFWGSSILINRKGNKYDFK